MATEPDYATREEFEAAYAEASHSTVEFIREWKGQDAEPCDCDYDECRGWKWVARLDTAFLVRALACVDAEEKGVQ